MFKNVYPQMINCIFCFLRQFLKNNYSSLCHFLEPVLSAKAKDEIAKVLVRILQSCGKAKEFLIDLVTTEMEKSGKQINEFCLLYCTDERNLTFES